MKSGDWTRVRGDNRGERVKLENKFCQQVFQFRDH